VSSLHAAAFSDVGLVRGSNQDSCLVDIEHSLFIVSDGMGGEQAGETAAKAVTSILPKVLEPYLPGLESKPKREVELTLRDSIVQFSQQLRQQASDQPGLKGMGATLALVWFRQDEAHLAHMGDSRIYSLRKDKLKLLTEDHSVIALLLKHGDITPEEAAGHPARGKLSRYIGMSGDVYPDVKTVKIHLGERFLLCSDGLWGMVSDEQITNLLLNNSEAESACRSLVGAANQAGGKDNITALVINIR
jgi:PPM family protein phosphatase